MFGQIEGKRHDAFRLGESGLTNWPLRLQKPNREPYVIYGDPAYGLTRNILAPFYGTHLTDDEQEFNHRMSKVRECWKDSSKLCISRLKKKLEYLAATCWKKLFGGNCLINSHTSLYGTHT